MTAEIRRALIAQDSMIFANDGQALKHTNYFDTPQGAAGFFYLSWNAGAARLLVPDSVAGCAEEMNTGRLVVMSRGYWPERRASALEIMFDDGSDSPFAITLEPDFADPVDPHKHPQDFAVLAYTRAGLVGTWNGKFRRVPELPCLLPWKKK